MSGLEGNNNFTIYVFHESAYSGVAGGYRAENYGYQWLTFTPPIPRIGRVGHIDMKIPRNSSQIAL